MLPPVRGCWVPFWTWFSRGADTPRWLTLLSQSLFSLKNKNVFTYGTLIDKALHGVCGQCFRVNANCVIVCKQRIRSYGWNVIGVKASCMVPYGCFGVIGRISRCLMISRHGWGIEGQAWVGLSSFVTSYGI